MLKRILAISLAVLCGICVTGSWNYQGFDDIVLVTGLAIDLDNESDQYHLTFEVADTSASSKDSGIIGSYVESTGATIFDAVRNAKKRLTNKLYGGNLQTLIISKQVAAEEGITSILEELLRDGEPRETMSVVISEEETAKEILLTTGLDSKLIALELHDMIREDSVVTTSTKYVPLYKCYSTIRGTGNSLVLPVVRSIENNEDEVVELNGIAVFSGDRLIGYIPPEQSTYYLFITGDARGGALSFPLEDENENVSMQIKNCKSKSRVDYSSGQISIDLSVNIELNLTEIKDQFDISSDDDRRFLEEKTEEYIAEELEAFFMDIQENVKTDIFSFGRLLYQKDPELWRSLEPEWDELFQKAVLNVHVDTDLLSAGVIKNY